MSLFEEVLFGAECLNTEEVSKYYPCFSKENILYMSLQGNDDADKEYIFAYVRSNLLGETYIEVDYFEDRCSDSLHRFVLKKNYMLEPTEEKLFLRITGLDWLSIDMNLFASFQEDIDKYYPEIHMPHKCEPEEVGKYLEQLYFSLFRSGAKEILFKAGLDKIAFSLNMIDDYNLIGQTPSEIFQMPMKLLKIINDLGFVERMYSIENRREEIETYLKFSSYIGKTLPNHYQWLYLNNYEDFGPEKMGSFNKYIYYRLRDCRNTVEYHYYKEFSVLQARVKGYSPYKKLPSMRNMIKALKVLKRINELLTDIENINMAIKARRNPEAFEYEDDTYMAILPENCQELIKESVSQDNCLTGYIWKYARGETNIVFVRKKDKPRTSYITMEISSDGDILQARARFNLLPKAKDFEFIEKYAKEKGFDFNLWSLLSEDEEEYLVVNDFEEELRNYIADYIRRMTGHDGYNDYGGFLWE